MKKKLIILLALLLVSTLVVHATGIQVRDRLLEPHGLLQDETPIKIPFIVMADDAVRYALTLQLPTAPEENSTEPVITEPVSTEPTEQMEQTEPPAEGVIEQPTEPPVEAPTEPLVITERWFDDVLFIGDSRIVGMRDMARLGKADYFCATSMTVFRVMESQCSDKDFYQKTLKEVLKTNTYGKVYIHLGLNECTYSQELILAKFQELVDLIRQTQPDAAIIIQSVMTVRDFFANNSNFTLERIYKLNVYLEEFAEENGLFYEDTNELIADEEGYMRPEISHDGAHLSGTGYYIWRDFTLANAVNWGIPEKEPEETP